MTIGLYNLVIVITAKSELAAARKIAKEQNVGCEEWEVRKGLVKRIQIRTPHEPAKKAPKFARHELLGISSSHSEAAREYRILILASLGRASHCLPKAADDLRQFDEMFRQVLAKSDFEPSYKHGLLVNTNAALSRQTEQTYAGTSPILENAGHFWPHSLLGIGIASLALIQVRTFVANALRTAMFFERLEMLTHLPSAPQALYRMYPRDDFFRKDHLCSKEVEDRISHIEEPEALLPYLSCFSGRDGFRSTEVSLSAPLELVGSCNTTAWTPLTLTHEISHIVVSGVLGRILPHPDKPQELRAATKLLDNDTAPNLFDQLRQFVCFAVWNLESDATSEKLIPDRLGNLLRVRHPEVNEIVTHCFDFLYFYQKDGKNYTSSVWSSWDVIPNILERIPDYILRTLCALHCNNIQRSNGFELTITQLSKYLRELRKEMTNAKYIPRAIEELKLNHSLYRTQLKNRESLIKFVRFFLYSPAIERTITREQILTDRDHSGGQHGGYPLRWFSLGSDRITNPIRFVSEFARDRESNALKSVWMLHQIAFASLQ